MRAVFRVDLDQLLKAKLDHTKYFMEIKFYSAEGCVNLFIAENMELIRSLYFTQAELRDL